MYDVDCGYKIQKRVPERCFFLSSFFFAFHSPPSPLHCELLSSFRTCVRVEHSLLLFLLLLLCAWNIYEDGKIKSINAMARIRNSDLFVRFTKLQLPLQSWATS